MTNELQARILAVCLQQLQIMEGAIIMGVFQIGSFTCVLLGIAAAALGWLLVPRRDREKSSIDHGVYSEKEYYSWQLGPMINIAFLVGQLVICFFAPVIMEKYDNLGHQIVLILTGVRFKKNFIPLNPLTWTFRMYVVIAVLIVYIVRFYKEYGQKTKLLIGKTIMWQGVFFSVFSFAEFLNAHDCHFLGALVALLLGFVFGISVLVWIMGLFGQQIEGAARVVNEVRRENASRTPPAPKKSEQSNTFEWPEKIIRNADGKVFRLQYHQTASAVYKLAYASFFNDGPVDETIQVSIGEIGELVGAYSPYE